MLYFYSAPMSRSTTFGIIHVLHLTSRGSSVFLLYVDDHLLTGDSTVDSSRELVLHSASLERGFIHI